MIDTTLIKSIIANGGWCEINSKNDTPLTKQLNGRIVLNAVDFLVLHRFNLQLKTLDGLYLIFKPNIKKLRKGNWIKRYLSIGGTTLQHFEVPSEFVNDNWFEILENLEQSKEVVKFKLESKDIFGSVSDYTPEEIQVSPALLKANNAKINVALGDLVCIEARTIELRKLRKNTGGS